MRTIRYIIILAAGLLLFSMLISCHSSADNTTQPGATQAIKTSQLQLTLVVDNLNSVLKSGIPVLAEFGRGTCIPCKQMKPILEELAVEYEGKLYVAIISVDSDEYYNLAVHSNLKIVAIPTQIFYNGNGEEVARHIGFYPEEDIIVQLKKMGIK